MLCLVRVQDNEEFVLKLLHHCSSSCPDFVREVVEGATDRVKMLETVYKMALTIAHDVCEIRDLLRFEYTFYDDDEYDFTNLYLAAVQLDAGALEYADSSIQDSEKVVAAAMRKNRTIGLRFASKRLRIGFENGDWNPCDWL